MQRHISDSTLAHIPHTPSRLNPHAIPSSGLGSASKRKSMSIAQGRGTMSMPTSPLRTGGNDEGGVGAMTTFPWNEGPQTAQAFFHQTGFPGANISSPALTAKPTPTQPAFFPDTQWFPPIPSYVPPSFFSNSARSASPAYPASAQHSHPTEGHYEREYDHEYEYDPDVPAPKKKRAQVRVACTHCQKACKKCSNTRPCERCVKYGFKDCVDSTRKPRKTGIKRGPYKRRTSTAYPAHHDVLAPAPPTEPAVAAAPVQALPPGPRALSQAFAAALERNTPTKWIDGQRQPLPQPPSSSQFPVQQTQNRASVSMPVPGIGNQGAERRPSLSGLGFPVSLNGTSGQDPFSRAVSPIGHKFSVDMGYFKSVDPGSRAMRMGMEGIKEEAPPVLHIGQGEVNVIDYAFHHRQPQQQQQQGAAYSLPPSPRSMMAVDPPPPPPPPGQGSNEARRPSLHTLLAASGPTLPPPTILGQGQGHGPGDESPTLFDGDHAHEHDHEMSFFPGTASNETRRMSVSMAGLPSIGAVGRLSLSKGSEGMGLGLGLEVGDQWR